ncbi:MAG: hypothetical protein ACI4PQ_05735, partial [Butyricicoccaceae bacterium]
MASQQKRTTTGSKKKTSGTSRKTTGRKTSASGRKTTTAARKSTARRTTTRKSTKKNSILKYMNRRMTGLLMCFVALLLVLSLLHYDGFLLKWINIFFTGLIGGGVYLFAATLVCAGILCMSRTQPYRLRAVCTLLIPVLWSALVQSVVYQNTNGLSFKAIGVLWKSGIAMQSGGALSGTLALLFTPALSQTGTRIILAALILVCLFAALNRTPWALAAQFSSFLADELDRMQEERKAAEAAAEPLAEGDMTVTPKKESRRKSKPEPQPAEASQPEAEKKPSLLARLRGKLANPEEENEMPEEQRETPVPVPEPVAAAAAEPSLPDAPSPSFVEIINTLTEDDPEPP